MSIPTVADYPYAYRTPNHNDHYDHNELDTDFAESTERKYRRRQKKENANEWELGKSAFFNECFDFIDDAIFFYCESQKIGFERQVCVGIFWTGIVDTVIFVATRTPSKIPLLHPTAVTRIKRKTTTTPTTTISAAKPMKLHATGSMPPSSFRATAETPPTNRPKKIKVLQGEPINKTVDYIKVYRISLFLRTKAAKSHQSRTPK